MANRAGFLVVYPNGSGRNPEFLDLERRQLLRTRHSVQNVERRWICARRCSRTLPRVAKIDEGRIFATGVSNGGMMAYRLASEMSDRIASIASVAGPMGTETCQATRPVSCAALSRHSRRIHPVQRRPRPEKFFAGRFSLGRVFHSGRGSKPTAARPQVSETRLPQQNHDGTTVTKMTWGPGKADSEVVLYTIHGGGHTWPGRLPPTRFLGLSTTEISANEVMWEFFSKHPMNGRMKNRLAAGQDAADFAQTLSIRSARILLRLVASLPRN